MPTDPDPSRNPDPLVIYPASDSPVISAQDAAIALRELFLTNADQGNHAANDAAAFATPVGRPCASCAAAIAPPTPDPARRHRHRQPWWLWRILRFDRVSRTEARRLP